MEVAAIKATFEPEEAIAVIDTVDKFKTISCGLLQKIFPDYNCEKITRHLLNKKRILQDADSGMLYAIQVGKQPQTIRVGYTTALSILLDVMAKVAPGTISCDLDYPALISFITESGCYFEVIHVTYGNEALVISTYCQDKVHDDSLKRIVIVQDEKQIGIIGGRIPNVAQYAIQQQNGQVDYLSPILPSAIDDNIPSTTLDKSSHVDGQTCYG